MATTEEYKNGGSASYSFSIEKIKDEDIKVAVDGTDLTYTATNPPAQTTEYTVNGSNVIFKQASVSGSTSGGVRIYRETALENSDSVTFQPGSAIRAADLNANHKLVRFSAQEKNQQIVTDEIKDAAITTAKIKNLNVTREKIADDAIDGTKIADDVINSEHYAAGSIDLEHMSANSVDSDQYVDGSIDLIHMSANSVDSDQYVDGSIDREHLEADIIDGSKLANDAVDSEHIASGAVNTDELANDSVTQAKIQAGAVGNTKLASNAVTTVKIAADAVNGTKIADASIDSEHYVDGSIDHVHLSNDCVDEDNIQDDAVRSEHIQANAVTDSEIATGTLDNRYYTEAELDAGQLDNRYYTETEAEARFLRQDSSETIASGVTWASNDALVATTAAIDLRIIELVDNVGGFVPIANETSFPTANPDINTSGSAKGGTIVSVQTASTALTAQSGTTLTIANGRGTGNAVIITGVSATIPQGYGFLVETTATDHTYAFHRLVPKATEVATVAANAVNIAAAGANVVDINNFADLYQISNSAPTQRADSSSLQIGDLWYDSSSNKVLMIYDGSSGDGFTAATPNASDLVNINIVAGQLVYQEDLGLITNAVSTGTGNNSVNTVAGSISNVNTVAGSISNVNAVAGNATNINNVANDATDIGAVAGKATEIGRLGTADAVADLAILGTTDVVADMNTLATSANVTAMDNCSDDIANINTVSGSIGNVNTTAGSITNVNTTAGSIANVNTTAGSIANVNTVAGAIANVNTTAGSITNVNTVASNITDVNTFANRYRIASSNPSTSLDVGDLYFNTSQNELRVYNGSAWQGGVTATGSLAGLAANTFTDNQTINGNIIVSGTVDGIDVAGQNTLMRSVVASTANLNNGVTATTQSASDNSTKVATTAYVTTAVSNLVDSAPGTLNTLNELAAALGDDANYATTTANSIATKAPLASPTFTGTVTAGTIDGANLTLDFGTL